MNLKAVASQFVSKIMFMKRSFNNRPFRLLDVGAGNHSATKIKNVFQNCEYHGVDLESYQSWVVFNRLQSKVGDLSREPFGYSIEGQDSTFAEVTYHLPAALPADATLSYRALASMRKAPIRLEFKGIPPW